MKLKLVTVIIVVIAFILPYIGLGVMYRWYHSKLDTIDNAAIIVVDKKAMTLTMYDYEGNVKHHYPMACGKALGNKSKQGDMKTPEGVFRISEVQDAKAWTHDFGDGKGEIDGAYGSHFIRLYVPGHKGIGIHGTHAPNSIGTRATEGCIRLNNENLKELVADVQPGMMVVITNDTIQTLKSK